MGNLELMLQKLRYSVINIEVTVLYIIYIGLAFGSADTHVLSFRRPILYKNNSELVYCRLVSLSDQSSLVPMPSADINNPCLLLKFPMSCNQ